MQRKADAIEAFNVAPFAGAWIEILSVFINLQAVSVAPFAGAWIEILKKSLQKITLWVAPFAGAWIEIATTNGSELAFSGRSLCGSVD